MLTLPVVNEVVTEENNAEFDLTREQEFEALENGGVDNWGGYEYAIDLANEDGFDWEDLENEEKLNYLENAGVDNWEGYDISREYLEAIILDLEEGELKDFMKR